jgi:uncharacterized protein (TIGR03437 family)
MSVGNSVESVGGFMLLLATLFFLPHYEITESHDLALSVLSDPSGNAYVVSGGSTSNGQTEFIARFDPEGKLVYRVTPAPISIDFIQATFDTAGDLYACVSGSPVGGGLEEGYIAKIDPFGNILFSLPIPVSYTAAIAIGADGSIYLTGGAYPGQLKTTPGAWVSSAQATPDQINPFVLKLSSDGMHVEYATFLNNSHTLNASAVVVGTAIAVDSSGHAFVAGTSTDPHFPTTPGAYQSQCCSVLPAAFAMKLAIDGSRPLYSTFLPSGDTPSAIKLDSAGEAHLTVETLGGASYFDGQASISAIATAVLSADGAHVTELLSVPLNPFLLPGAAFGEFNMAAVPDGSGNFVVTGQAAPDGLASTEDTFTSGSNFVALVRGSDRSILYSSRLPKGAAGFGVSSDAAGGFFVLGGNAGIPFSYMLTHFIQSSTAQPAVLGVADATGLEVADGLAPGEVVAIYGSAIGPTQPAQGRFDSSGHLPVSLGGTRVFLNGIAAPILFAGKEQIDAVVPFEISGSSNVSIQVDVNGQFSNTARIQEQLVSPHIWQQIDPSAANYGYAFAINQDGTVNSPQHPAHPGWIVAIVVNGAGVLNPLPQDGVRAPAGIAPVASLSLEAGTGQSVYPHYVMCPLLYGASAPGEVAGKVQINFRLPLTNLLEPTTPLLLQVGAETTTALLWSSASK